MKVRGALSDLVWRIMAPFMAEAWDAGYKVGEQDANDESEPSRRKQEIRTAHRSAILCALGLGPRQYPQTPEQRFAKAMDYAARRMQTRGEQ